MNVDSRLPEFAFAPSAAGARSFAPAWCLRWTLRWTDHCIRRLESTLGDEFATDSTAPLHAELAALAAERDALVSRLRDAGHA